MSTGVGGSLPPVNLRLTESQPWGNGKDPKTALQKKNFQCFMYQHL